MRGRNPPLAFAAVAAAGVFGAWYDALGVRAVDGAAYGKLIGGAGAPAGGRVEPARG